MTVPARLRRRPQGPTEERREADQAGRPRASRSPATRYAARRPPSSRPRRPSSTQAQRRAGRRREAKLAAAPDPRPADAGASWPSAEARLEHARGRPGRSGRADLDAQRDARRPTRSATIYQDGDPQLLAVSLDAGRRRTPRTSPGPRSTSNVVVEQGDRDATTSCARPRSCSRSARSRSRTPATEVAVQRKAAAEHLVAMQDADGRGRATPAPVSASTVGAQPRRAAGGAAGPRGGPARSCAQLKAQEHRIKQLILERRAQGQRAATTARPAASSTAPCPAYVTSPFGYRAHPIYGYYGLHDGTDFGAACGTPLYAAAGGTVLSRYYSSVYGNRLVPRPRQRQRQVRVGDLQPRHRLPASASASASRAARSSGTPARTGWSTGCHLHFTVLVERPARRPDELAVAARSSTGTTVVAAVA